MKRSPLRSMSEKRRLELQSGKRPVPRIGAANKKKPPKKSGNSNPWINLPLRRKYRKANTECELQPFLNIYEIKLPEFHAKNGLCVHHIFHKSERLDVVSNLAVISNRAHNAIHNGMEFELTVLLLWRKLWKQEFDVGELNKAKGAVEGSGARPAEVYLESRECKHEEIEALRVALVRYCGCASITDAMRDRALTPEEVPHYLAALKRPPAKRIPGKSIPLRE